MALVELTLRKKKGYGDVQITELLKVNQPQDSIIAFGPIAPLKGLENKRLVLPDGNLRVDIARNSYRWPNQVPINVWSPDPWVLEDRPFNDNYNRNSIPLGLETAREIARGLDRLLSGGYPL